MSSSLAVLQMQEGDILKFLAAETHLGGTNLYFRMKRHIYKRTSAKIKGGQDQGWEAGMAGVGRAVGVNGHNCT